MFKQKILSICLVVTLCFTTFFGIMPQTDSQAAPEISKAEQVENEGDRVDLMQSRQPASPSDTLPPASPSDTLPLASPSEPAAPPDLPLNQQAANLAEYGGNALQTLIENDTTGTITLVPGKIYAGNIEINKDLIIIGDGTAVINGDVICTASVKLNKVIIEGSIHSTDAFDMQDCTVSGGVIIEDTGEKITIQGSKLHYTNSVPALNICGASEDTDVTNYQIGTKTDMYSVDRTKANTFINEGDGEADAIVWPFTSRLAANGNYWKLGGRDAWFYEVKVEGNLKYANELVIVYKNPPLILVEPTEGFPFQKGSYGTHPGYIEHEDRPMVLFDRSFTTNGTPPPSFSSGKIKQIDAGWDTAINLPKSYDVKFYTSIYTDGDYRTPYSPEKLKSTVWGDGTNLYFGLLRPMLTITITSKDMISYAGTSEALSEEFPRVWYAYRIPNIWYGIAAYSNSDQEFISINNNIRYLGGLNKNVSILAAYLLDKSKYFEPWEIAAESEWGLDPDGDFMPFTPGFYHDEASSFMQTNRAGVYTVQVKNADHIPEIEYRYTYHHFDGSEPVWDFFSVASTIRYVKNDMNYLFPHFQPSELAVRPTSGNLTVTDVDETLSFNSVNPDIKIAADAEYKDSTGQVIDLASVSLLNDNKEPVEEAYTFMLNTAKTTPATRDKAYEYHFLSLLNVSDGNNVITTRTAKTVFIPYPKDYKEGGSLSLMYFDGYQRMPSDDIGNSTVSVIQGDEITKSDKGFTFTTSSDMGAYLIAYDSNKKPNPPESTDSTEATGSTKPIAPTEPANPSETKDPAETTGSPEPTSPPSPSKSTGSGDSGDSTTATSAVTTAPATSAVIAPPSTAVSTGEAETIAPTRATILPNDPDLPDTPGFRNTPESGGEIVKGPDDVFYFISDEGVPLAFYLSETDSWSSLNGQNLPFLRLPKTGEHGGFLWSFAIGASAIAVIFVIAWRRREE